MAGLVESPFHSSFRTFGGGSFDVESWASYFLKYDPEQWIEEGDGVIKYRTDGKEYSLVFVHVPQQGFVIQNGCHNLTTNRGVWCKFGVESASELSEFVEVGEGLIYPKGCIVRPSTAWSIVKDFLQNPTSSTKPITMIDDGSIEWPEF
jgi:hypothetical protein